MKYFLVCMGIEQKVGGKKVQKKVIILDGDDTLWYTQELYDSAKNKFLEVINFPELKEEIKELIDEIDTERVKILKFSKTRFMESLLITYAILCGKYNRKWEISVEEKIREIGLSVFVFPPQLYEDSISSLQMLSKHFTLILFTNGDREIQEKKIDSLGKDFKSFFKKIYISETKNEDEYMKIINDLKISPAECWVIGNSVKSDINPAIKLGLKAVLVARGGWKYEKEEILSDVISVNSLTEATKVIIKKETSEHNE